MLVKTEPINYMYGFSIELLISPSQKCININTDKKHISLARSRAAFLGVCAYKEVGHGQNSQSKGQEAARSGQRCTRVRRLRPRTPPHPDRAGSSNTRESPLGFHICHVPKDRDRLQSRRRLALTGGCVVPEQPQVCRGRGRAAGFHPLHGGSCDRSDIPSLILRPAPVQGGGGARPGRGVAERVRRALASGGSRRFAAGEARARAPRTRSRALVGAAGGAEAPGLLQEPRPIPVAAPPASSGPRAPRLPYAPRESHTPRLLPRCARWLRARMPRAAAATVAAALVAPAAAAAAAAAAQGPGEVRGARGWGLGPALGVRSGRRAVRSHLSGTHRASPPYPSRSWLARAEAALGGRAGGAGGAGSAASGGSCPGAPVGWSLICRVQRTWRLLIRLPWLSSGLRMGVRETIRLCLAYFGEFGSEPKAERVSDCQISRF